MVVEDVSEPGSARAGHVIVRPERVGICGSDFHLFSGDVGALSGSRDFYPRIQGHEVSAVVDDPGDSGKTRGERVAIWPLLPCGRCYPCRIGRPNVCATAADFGEAIRLVAANRAAVSHLFSHHFPLDRAAEAFEFAMSRPPDAIKIVVTVN
jgi:threonine dehydrogenase-like Zn-dependent dehydrogenase